MADAAIGEGGVTMRVAAVSNRNLPGFPERNLVDHLRWIRRAAGEGARLVLFPELSLSGYSTAPFLRDVAMTLRSAPCRALIRAARERDIFVAFGLPLRRARRLFISQALVGPRGMVGHYEKVHLAGGAQGEGRVFSPGSEFRVFSVDGVSVGINICFDGRHPGSSLCLAHVGAEVILHPHGNTVGTLGREPREWTRKKRAYLGPRAVDTCTYVLICNSVGDVRDRAGQLRRFSGGALVLGPAGQFVARSASSARRPHMIVADLDVEGLRRTRSSSSFAQRRPDVYVRALAGHDRDDVSPAC
jgi:N-carbamoylputrescine amidase